MKRLRPPFVPVALALAAMLLTVAGEPVAEPDVAPARSAAATPGEARVRAQLLHAAIDGALQVMHRDFFRKGDSKAIPSASLKDVFQTMADEWGITLRWLASEETIMNVDNQARDAFGKRALKAIAGGEKEVVALEGDTLRYAGVIVLRNECLKCHVSHRSDLKDRFAALEIIIPAKPAAP